MSHCSICGHSHLEDRPVLWPELISQWELSEREVEYVNLQQGRTCLRCGGNLRTMVLANSLLEAWGAGPTLDAFVKEPRARFLEILDLNAAAGIGPVLGNLPGYKLSSFPEEDMQALSYADETFDLVIHSDTLEHVPDPVAGLRECRRVLRAGGLLACTVPIIVGRLTRRRDGMAPSYHGDPSQSGEDFRVQTEYGADAWCQVMEAGFDRVTLTTLDYPSAHAITARRPHAVQ